MKARRRAAEKPSAHGLPPRAEEKPHRDLAALTHVAQTLRDLPREEFREALKTELQRRAAMNEATGQAVQTSGAAGVKTAHYMRPGVTSITPYIIIPGAAQ